MNFAIIVTLATVVLGAVFLFLEFLVRRFGASAEFTRRGAHFAACGYAVGIYSVLEVWVFVVIALTFVVLMIASKVLRVLRSIHDTRRITWGEVYLPVGLALTAIVSGADWRAFVVATVILGLADPAAGLTGQLRGAVKKTHHGTAVFVVVALAVCVAARYGLVLSVVTAGALAAVERVCGRGSDNLTVPVTAALMLVSLEG